MSPAPPHLEEGDPCPVCTSPLATLTPSVLHCSDEECARVFLSSEGHARLAARLDTHHAPEPGSGICHCGACALSAPLRELDPLPAYEAAPETPPEVLIRTPLRLVAINPEPEPVSAPRPQLRAVGESSRSTPERSHEGSDDLPH